MMLNEEEREKDVIKGLDLNKVVNLDHVEEVKFDEDEDDIFNLVSKSFNKEKAIKDLLSNENIRTG